MQQFDLSPSPSLPFPLPLFAFTLPLIALPLPPPPLLFPLHLSTCLYLSIYLSIYVSFYVYLSQFIYLSLYLYIYIYHGTTTLRVTGQQQLFTSCLTHAVNSCNITSFNILVWGCPSQFWKANWPFIFSGRLLQRKLPAFRVALSLRATIWSLSLSLSPSVGICNLSIFLKLPWQNS